ncbi:unnamed protein product, partial [Oppiella nova]
MFWIHGGGLNGGSVELYNGSVLATNDVVVVAVNYRLGWFGFIYGDREDAPGNVGFYDQLLALKWVRENIHQFGGDRDRITIFGESAGSWSVSAHVLSPLTRGLFRRAIMQSGSILGNKDRDPVNKTEALNMAKELSKQLNCTEGEDWLKCLRGVDPSEFAALYKKPTYAVFGTQYLPVSAQNAFENNNFNTDIDLIAGITQNEGSTLSEAYMGRPKNMTVQTYNELLANLNARNYPVDVDSVTNFYLRGVNRSNSTALRWAFYDLFADLCMNCPTYLFAKQMAKQMGGRHNVYFYELTYQMPEIAQLGRLEGKGIIHGMDVPFVFGIPFLLPDIATPVDVNFSLH